MDGYLGALARLQNICVVKSGQLVFCLLDAVYLRQIIFYAVTVIVCVMPVGLYLIRSGDCILKICTFQIDLRNCGTCHIAGVRYFYSYVISDFVCAFCRTTITISSSPQTMRISAARSEPVSLARSAICKVCWPAPPS